MTTSLGGRPTTAAIAAVVGGVIGGNLFAWLGRVDAAPAPPPSRSEAAVTEPAREVTRESRIQRLRDSAVEARLQALEEARSGEPTSEDAPEAVDPPTQQEMEARHAERVRAHHEEELNPHWARETSAAFAADFLRNEGTNFSVADVECRSTTCSVVLEWPSRDLALNEWKRALVQPTRANCGRSIVVPEQTAGDTGPLQATLLLDCSTWVEQGSRLLPEEQLPRLAP